MNWYNVKVDCTESADPSKKFSVQYLVKGESCTDAEFRLVESDSLSCYEEYVIDSINRKIYSEVLGGDFDKWYMAKVALITLDEKSGTEKRKNKAVLVNADTLEDAVLSIRKHYENDVNYDLNAIIETILEDVIDAE